MVNTAELGARQSALADPGESTTRDRVLRTISEHGPITATGVATRLDLTATAIRRHLDHLAEQGMVEEHEPPAAPRGRGRPARSYVVSERGHRALGSDYDHLALQAVRLLAEIGGRESVSMLAERRAAEMQARYAAPLAAAGSAPSARVDVLVRELTTDGYAASARPVGCDDTVGARHPDSQPVGIQLCQGHCPVQHVAAEFPQLCDAETEAFSRLLGVHVQRLATLAHGDHVCTTFVPTSAGAARPAAPETTTEGSIR